MVHKMNLWHDSFEKIKEKTKTIEMRLNDVKRSRIKKGDMIEFIDTSNSGKINCLVINLYKYSSFDELYQNHNKIQIGYDENDCPNPLDMLEYYSIDDIKQYGVVGIEIRVI
ncbi:ASCH domain-containing protein [Anaerosporobacter faecicola]|uniref:ASCH domain-containing protein n=1 Tax=Anaerosporobacter faecicola TaxID=2718714 RepID=UPI00143ACE6A|nr:ASCH domain-containing protein [Anaerosporobacter faecicola]